MEALLEARQMDVKAENLRRERVLNGQVFGAPNAFLPGSIGHRAIMGLSGRGTQPAGDGPAGDGPAGDGPGEDGTGRERSSDARAHDCLTLREPQDYISR